MEVYKCKILILDVLKEQVQNKSLSFQHVTARSVFYLNLFNPR
jgi:hypothetical protein